VSCETVTGRAALIRRTAGAVRHAFWLRGHLRGIEMVSQDLRYGWRSLVRKPGFDARPPFAVLQVCRRLQPRGYF
jgi:hypothetical protein